MKWKLGEDIAVIGAKGSGKTVFLHNVFYTSDYAICYNLLREAGFLYLADGYIKGDIHQLRKAVRSGTVKRICYLPTKATVMSVDRLRSEYSDILEMAYEQGNYTVVNDDIAYITKGEFMTEQMNLSTLWGRHKNFTHAFAGQRNQLMPKTLVTQASHWIVYWVREYDATAYSKFLGADLGRYMKRLRDYEYLHFHHKTTEICPPVPCLVNEKNGAVIVKKNMPIEVTNDVIEGKIQGAREMGPPTPDRGNNVNGPCGRDRETPKSQSDSLQTSGGTAKTTPKKGVRGGSPN